jgi:hypothetical protein
MVRKKNGGEFLLRNPRSQLSNMTIQDDNKALGRLLRASGITAAQERRSTGVSIPEADVGVLSGIITLAIPYGDGTVCDVEVLSSGAMTGQTLKSIFCESGTLTEGDRTIVILTAGSQPKLIPAPATGSASGGSTTNIVYDTFTAP